MYLTPLDFSGEKFEQVDSGSFAIGSFVLWCKFDIDCVDDDFPFSDGPNSITLKTPLSYVVIEACGPETGDSLVDVSSWFKLIPRSFYDQLTFPIGKPGDKPISDFGEYCYHAYSGVFLGLRKQIIPGEYTFRVTAYLVNDAKVESNECYVELTD